MPCRKEKKFQYVIGIDGGGTKTVAVLADLKGRVLAKTETGSSNPLKVKGRDFSK